MDEIIVPRRSSRPTPVRMTTIPVVELEQLREENARLREEIRKLQTDREGWAARSKADFDRLGNALEPVRRKRRTGEPACSDGEAVEELVAERDRLREHNNTLKHALSDAIEELETLTPPVFGTQLQKHRRWMDGLRAALAGQEAE